MEKIIAIEEIRNQVVVHRLAGQRDQNGRKETKELIHDGYMVLTDNQIIELTISKKQQCCEAWGYFWCNDNPQDFIGAELINVSITDTALNTKNMREIDEVKENTNDEAEIMFVNLETNMGVLQFVAYNVQNGYYGHLARVKSTQINHEETL